MRGMVQITWVALRDYVHEYQFSIVSVAALTAVLTPLLVLFGLKHGIVSTMIGDLKRSPQTLLVQPLGQGRYHPEWLEALNSRQDVGFLLPTTRYLSATMELAHPDVQRGPLQRAEMWPTSSGDPLWTGAPPEIFEHGVGVVVSHSLAQRLGVGEGDTIQGRIGRVDSAGNRQGVRVTLLVLGVIVPELVQRDVALVPLPFLVAVEDYREGNAVPQFGWEGNARSQQERVYASFRLYAASIDDVAHLRDHLAKQGIDTETAAAQIEMVRQLDRSLTVLFLIISGLAAVGYGFSMTLNLVATVVRKQQDLSILKMLGFSNGAVALFPVVQATMTALLGCLAGFSLYYLVEPAINHLFRDGLREGQVVCALLPVHLWVALALSLAVAFVTASLGGFRAARIPPAEGLRHE